MIKIIRKMLRNIKKKIIKKKNKNKIYKKNNYQIIYSMIFKFKQKNASFFKFLTNNNKFSIKIKKIT